MILQLPSRTLDLGTPRVMGVLNVTPDSFSDGGRHAGVEAALQHARLMVAQGAAIIDVGGESTRPGAAPVAEQEELERVVPVVERIRRELDCVVSVDTMKAAVMDAACAAGAELVNDVYALRAPGAIEAVRRHRAAVCLMHMQGQPRDMQREPHYDDVLGEVTAFLAQRASACEAAGIAATGIVLDPGIGFGKTDAHNLRLLSRLDMLAGLGRPLLIGVSRKSMFGRLLGLPLEERLSPGLATAAVAVWQGARIVRAHDVAATTGALKIIDKILQARMTEQ
ncbi:MAG: dihydropteroate synthase [Nevskia sp.]|nr:dihydropteroate synthase [Nevskia sp.]